MRGKFPFCTLTHMRRISCTPIKFFFLFLLIFYPQKLKFFALILRIFIFHHFKLMDFLLIYFSHNFHWKFLFFHSEENFPLFSLKIFLLSSLFFTKTRKMRIFIQFFFFLFLFLSNLKFFSSFFNSFFFLLSHDAAN